jgi:hypothetical protein
MLTKTWTLSQEKYPSRGLLCKVFDDCVMFPLPTVFLTNAAEQERYYLMNMLKKP